MHAVNLTNWSTPRLDAPCSASRLATFIFVSPDISGIRIDLYRAGTAADRFAATARPIWFAEYLYKTLPHSLRSPVKLIRYLYDPPFLCAVSHPYPRPDVYAVSVVKYHHLDHRTGAADPGGLVAMRADTRRV